MIPLAFNLSIVNWTLDVSKEYPKILTLVVKNLDFSLLNFIFASVAAINNTFSAT